MARNDVPWERFRAADPGAAISQQRRLVLAAVAMLRGERRPIRVHVRRMARLAAAADIPNIRVEGRRWRDSWLNRLDVQIRRIIRSEDRAARDILPDELKSEIRAARKFQVRKVETAHLWGSTLKELADRTQRSTVTESIRLARLPERTRKLKTFERTVRRALNRRTVNHVQAVTRMAASNAVARAHMRVWRESGAERVRWVSILDGRTSDTCKALSGQVWPIDQAEIPPAHPGCRSTLAPIYGDGPRQPVDYGTWLRGQDAGRQDEILGRRRGQQFRDGAPLREVVRWNGNLPR